MANPNVRLKRSAVAGKRPEISQLELGEVALNTNDGRLFTRKYNVGIGSTVTLLNPWTENIGGSIYYNDGNVGIGTTNPAVGQLQVSSGPVIIGAATSTGTATQRLQVSGGAYVSGAFGIGTTNPGYTLDVLTGGGARVGTANTSTIINPTFVEIGVGSSTLTTLIDFHGADDVYPDYAGRLIRASGANSAFSLINRGTGALQIYAQDAGTIDFLTNSATPRGRVDALGNFLIGSTSATGTASQPLQVTGSAYVSTALGIGRTDPVANGVALDVSGNAQITNYGGAATVIELGKGQTGNQFALIDFVGDTTYTDYGLRIIRDNTGANANSNIYHRGTGAFQLFTQDAAPIDFYTNTTFRHRIDSSGNFLVGTASSTGTANQRLQVTGSAYVSGNVGIGTTNPTQQIQVGGIGTDAGLVITGIGSIGIATNNPVTYIDIPINTPTKNTVQFGSFGIQSFDNVNGFLSNNGYWDGEKWIYRRSGHSSLLQFINGNIWLRTLPVGTAGSTATIDTRIAVQNNGNIGINTNNPIVQVQIGSNSPNVIGITSSGNVGIGTTNPQKSIHIYTNDGDIKIGDITEGAAATDVGVIFTGLGTVTSAIFTEINGTLFSYGTNCAQITGIETGRIGGLFRLDTRTSGAYGDSNCFVLKGRSIGSTTEYNALVVGLNEGNTYLSPTKGDVLIGTSSSTGTANQRLQVTGSAYVSTALGIGRTDPVANGVALDVSGNAQITNYGGTTVLELGKGQTGNQFAIIDFVGDTTYTDYALRIIRDNTGANADSNIYHRGTGALRLYTVDSAPIDFRVSNSSYVSRYTSDGNFLINTLTPTGTASQPLQVSGGAYFNGFVGIGTTNPLARLSIGAGSISDGNVPVQINAPTGGIQYYGANNNGSYGALFGYDKVGFSGGVLRVVGATDSLDFVVNNNTRAVTITPSANVGIGTTNPTSKIHIIGNSLVSGISSAIGGFNIGISSNGTLINSGPLTNINFVGVANTYSVSGTTVNITNAAYKTILIKRRFGIAAITTYGSYTIKSRTTTYTFNTSGTGVVVKLRTGISTAPYSTNSGTTVLYSENVVGGIASVTSLSVSGTSSVTDTRLNSVSEKSTLVSGNTVNLVYNTGSGNVAICTNPTGPITLNVTGIPTDSSFDNRVLTFSVIVIQGTTGYACTTVNLNGVPETVRYPGGVISVGSTGSYDIFNFTGINTVGSASTAANYQVLGLVNGNFR